MELKKKIEALLFASGRKMTVEELAKLVRTRKKEEVAEALAELKAEYEKSESPMMIFQESDHWKLTTREQYLELVRQINPHTEFTKTVMETLAVIAWKQPMLQSDVIKVRTNKAYDHIKELMEAGFIVKERYGRTYLLKLTQKFYEYFDLRNDAQLKAMFKDIKEAAVDQRQVGEFEDNGEAQNIVDSNDVKEFSQQEVLANFSALPIAEPEISSGVEVTDGLEADSELIEEAPEVVNSEPDEEEKDKAAVEDLL